MARLRDAPIGVADMQRFLEAESDFSFELQVVRALTGMGLNCEHGGHYVDPVTKKSREFDIRLHVEHGNLHIYASIECKNIRVNFPLLVSCVPRMNSESWHHVAILQDQAKGGGGLAGFIREKRTLLKRMQGNYTRYPEGGLVGKSTAQVGVTLQGELTSNDSELYEKWGQSLSSLHDLGSRVDELASGSMAMMLPIIVVPDGRLWQAAYDTDGKLVRDPEQVDHCEIYAGGAEIPLSIYESLSISHVEVMTYMGLIGFVRRYLLNGDLINRLFAGD